MANSYLVIQRRYWTQQHHFIYLPVYLIILANNLDDISCLSKEDLYTALLQSSPQMPEPFTVSDQYRQAVCHNHCFHLINLRHHDL